MKLRKLTHLFKTVSRVPHIHFLLLLFQKCLTFILILYISNLTPISIPIVFLPLFLLLLILDTIHPVSRHHLEKEDGSEGSLEEAVEKRDMFYLISCSSSIYRTPHISRFQNSDNSETRKHLICGDPSSFSW